MFRLFQQLPAFEEFTATEREKARNLKGRRIRWLSGCSRFRAFSRSFAVETQLSMLVGSVLWRKQPCQLPDW
jgi:hypothetical protein